MKKTLTQIVGQFLNSSDKSTHEFRRLYNIAVAGLKDEFNLSLTGTLKTVVLEVNANKTVAMPDDYIQYSKIGILNGQGEIITFKRNDQLSALNAEYTTANVRNGDASLASGDVSLYNSYSNYYWNFFDGGTSFKLYGAGSGTASMGEYKILESQRLILLDARTSYSHLVLEYLSDGFDSENEDYEVDIRASQAMVAYIRWQNAIDLYKKFSQSQVTGFKREYYREKRLAATKLNPFILNEANHASRVSVHLAPKA